MIDCSRLHSSHKDYNEKSRAWQVGNRQGFFLESHVNRKPDELTTFAIEVHSPKEMRLLHEFSYKVEGREKSIQDFLQNIEEKTGKTVDERRQKLVTESKKFLEEICEQYKVSPQFKHILTDLLDGVSSELLDD